NSGVNPLQQAIFLDRDGTIGGADKIEYPGQFQLFPFVRESISRLKNQGNLILSFTNQPGISKGDATRKDYEEELARFGFDGIYLCPHQANEGCQCRKPLPGMLWQAAKDYNLNIQKCVVIGDRWTDTLAAHEVGCMKILVKTGAGQEAFNKYKNQEYFGKWAEVSPDFITDHIHSAVNWVLNQK